MFLMSLADIIKTKMSELHSNNEDFAKKAGFGTTYLNQIMNHGRVPSEKKIKNFAKVFHIDVNNIKEFKLIKLKETIDRMYKSFTGDDFQRIEDVLYKKYHIAKNINQGSENIQQNDVLDISILPKEEKKLIKDQYHYMVQKSSINNKQS